MARGFGDLPGYTRLSGGRALSPTGETLTRRKYDTLRVEAGLFQASRSTTYLAPQIAAQREAAGIVQQTVRPTIERIASQYDPELHAERIVRDVFREWGSRANWEAAQETEFYQWLLTFAPPGQRDRPDSDFNQDVARFVNTIPAPGENRDAAFKREFVGFLERWGISDADGTRRKAWALFYGGR